MTRNSGLRVLVYGAFSLVLSLVGCSREITPPTAPLHPLTRGGQSLRAVPSAGLTPTGRSFYPLQVGSHWTYEGSYSRTEGPKHGAPRVTKSGTWTREVALVGRDSLAGNEYVREELTLQGQVVHGVLWLRQDKNGLYEVGPPPLPQYPDEYSYPYETCLLSYPVHAGAKWVIDEARRITAEVERMDLVDTPAGRFRAWRIHVRDGGHLPTEEQYAWYGPQGYLGQTVHTQSQRRYPNGDTVIVTDDQAEWLKAYEVTSRTAMRGATR